MRKSILSTTISPVFTNRFGTTNGNIIPTKAMTITPDESFLISAPTNNNADYSYGLNSEALVICLYATTGSVNWMSRLTVAGSPFVAADMVVS